MSINQLLHYYTPYHTFNSSDSKLLVIYESTGITYGDRSLQQLIQNLELKQLLLAIRQSNPVDSLKMYLFQEKGSLYEEYCKEHAF